MDSNSHDIIQDTAKHVLIDYDSKRVHRIEELIVNGVKAILEKVAKAQPLFKVSELLKVGGFYEGTKIIEPNEFDYLAVFEELSKPGSVAVELDSSRAGIARLKLNESLNVDGKWDNFCSNGYVRCIQLDEELGNGAKNRKYEIFGREVVKAVYLLNCGKLRHGIRQFTDIVYGDYPSEYKCDMYELEQAMIRSVEVKFPNILLQFIIEHKRIDVDLCPAVRNHNVKECLAPEQQCLSPFLADFIDQHGSLLLVGQIDCDVRVSFTETEMAYIKDSMLERHKLVYVYLKFVSSIIWEYYLQSFPSYVMKNACIRHDIQCRRPNRKSAECLNNVLDILHEDVATRWSSSVFNSSVNVIAKQARLGVYMMKSVIPYLKMIIPLLSYYSNVSNNHENQLRSLIKEAKREYDERDLEHQMELLYSRRQ